MIFAKWEVSWNLEKLSSTHFQPILGAFHNTDKNIFLFDMEQAIPQQMSKLNHLYNAEKVPFVSQTHRKWGDNALKVCPSMQRSLNQVSTIPTQLQVLIFEHHLGSPKQSRK